MGLSTHAVKEILRPYYLRWLYFPLVRGARPDYFQSCWRYPYRRLDEAPFLNRVEVLGCAEHAVIVYPINDGHSRMQRPQHLARALARLGHPVLLLNPHLGRQFERVRLLDRQHRLSVVGPSLLELHVRLPREPVFHHRMLTTTESHIVADAVRRVADAAGWRMAIQIVSLPIWMQAADNLRSRFSWPIVYDCHDFLAGLPAIAPTITRAEDDALTSADLVLYSSQYLCDHHAGSATSTRSMLLRNAADGASAVGRPNGEAAAARPIAGYVGALAEWFDTEAVRRAAILNPDVDFVLAGRIEHRDVMRLEAAPNVHLIGEVPHADLPRLLSSFRVGLIPFRRNRLTLATNPVKLYEYFGHGMPVVSAPLPEVERYDELVYLASNPGEFAAQVRRSLLEDGDVRRRRRLRIAARETWLARAKDLSSELRSLMPDRFV